MGSKDVCQREIRDRESEILGLSHRIHEFAELGFAEHESARTIIRMLETAGFSISAGTAGLDTAFIATRGNGPLTVGICVEYDALPQIGHACGHNVISAAGVAAALGLAPQVEDLGITLKVFGTPAEENGGGKVLMLDAGAFDGVDLAMMVHPANKESSRSHCLAIGDVTATFHGKNAHASAAPYEGINAGDAVTLTQVAVGLLRQQLRPGDQLHGIVTNGGEAANIIPATASVTYNFRSPTLESLALLEARLRRCAEGAALATGCTVEFTSDSPPYSDFVNDETMADLYRANAEALGRVFDHEDDTSPIGSTDMANVSKRLPAIHPMLGLDCGDAVNHQPEFTAHCVGPSADAAAIEGGLAMAWTIIDIATNPDLRDNYLAVQ